MSNLPIGLAFSHFKAFQDTERLKMFYQSYNANKEENPFLCEFYKKLVIRILDK